MMNEAPDERPPTVQDVQDAVAPLIKPLEATGPFISAICSKALASAHDYIQREMPFHAVRFVQSPEGRLATVRLAVANMLEGLHESTLTTPRNERATVRQVFRQYAEEAMAQYNSEHLATSPVEELPAEEPTVLVRLGPLDAALDETVAKLLQGRNDTDEYELAQAIRDAIADPDTQAGTHLRETLWAIGNAVIEHREAMAEHTTDTTGGE